MTMTAENPHRITSWGQALKKIRLEFKDSHHTVGNMCGVGQSLVRDWEDGIAIPNRHHLRCLYGKYKALLHYNELLPRQVPERNEPPPALPQKPLAAPLAAVIQLHGQQPPTLPKPEPKRPETFGAALRMLRKKAKMSRLDVAKKMEVAEQTVYIWETNEHAPVLDRYMELMQIFPELKDMPRPSSKDWQKPGGTTYDDSETPQETVEVASPPTPSPPPVPPIPEPLIQAKNEAPREEVPMDLAKLGAEYALALAEEQRAKKKHEDAQYALMQTEEDLKNAQTKREQAHNALMNATGVKM